MNVNPARVTPTPTAPTLLVHISPTVLLVIMEMVLIAKLKKKTYVDQVCRSTARPCLKQRLLL